MMSLDFSFPIPQRYDIVTKSIVSAGHRTKVTQATQMVVPPKKPLVHPSATIKISTFPKAARFIVKKKRFQSQPEKKKISIATRKKKHINL